MLIIIYSVMSFVLSRGELVVERKNDGLTSVPKDINAEVTTLNLDGNAITRLENDSFGYLVSLEILYMMWNGITFIERHALEKNINLHFFDMYEHKLSILPEHLGGASQRIVTLGMQVYANDMETMQLINFLSLCKLVMSHNKVQTGNLIMESLPELEELYAPNCNLHVFPNLSAAPLLKIVQLHFNHFHSIPESATKNLSRLHTLALMGCNVTHLPDMSHLASLKKFVINNNKLLAIPDLHHLPLKWLEWAVNPMDYSKSLCWVRMWDDIKPKVLNLDVSSGSQLTCASPTEMAGVRLTDIHPVTMKCYTGDSNLGLLE